MKFNRWLPGWATRTVRLQSKRRGRAGGKIQYRKLLLQALEERIAPATITWGNAGGGDWDTASNWSGGVLPGAGDDVVIPALNSGASVTHSSGTDTVNSITSSATLALSGGTLTVTGSGLTLQGGTIDFSNGSALDFSGTQMLGTATGSTGSVDFNGGSINLTDAGMLTIGSGVTVHGVNGAINAGSGTIDNQGTIDADTSSVFSLTLSSGSGGSWTNDGTLEANSGGTLNLAGTWTNAADGQITVNSSKLGFGGTWTNRGTLTSRGTSYVYLGGTFNLATLGNYTRDSGGNDLFILTGTLNLSGETLDASAGPGDWVLDNATINGGLIDTTIKTNDPNAVYYGETSTLQDVTIEGTLTSDTVRGSDTVNVTGGGLTLQGGTIDIDNGDSLNFSGTQTLGTATGSTGSVDFNGGSINLSNAGMLTIGSGMTVHGVNGSINAGSGTIDNQGTIDADTNSVFSLTLSSGSGGSWTNDGTLEANSGGTLNLAGTWTNAADGQITVNSSKLGFGGAWSNQGTLTSRGTSYVYLGGTFNLATLGKYTRDPSGNDLFILTGTLNLSGETLDASAGPGDWVLDNATINGGLIDTTIKTNDPNAVYYGETSTLQDVTIEGTLTSDTVRGSDTVNVTGGGLTLQGGTINIDNGDSLNFSGTQTLGTATGSTGSVDFNGGSINVEGSGGQLTFGAGVTIHGIAAAINAGSGTIDNQGTIDADTANGGLVMTISSDTGGSWKNDGTVEATGAGSLVLTGSWTNDGGGQILDTGRSVSLTGSWTNSNPSTLQVSDGSSLNLSGNWTNIAPFSVTSGATLNISGNWSNSTAISADAATVNLSGAWADSSTINETASTVNLGGSFKTSTLGTLEGSGGTFNIAGAVTNDATLSLTGSTISPLYYLQGGTITGGTVVTTDGAELVATKSGGTLDGVTLSGTLFTGQIINTYVDVKDGLALAPNAVVTMEGNGELDFLGSQSLSGTGTVDFADNDVLPPSGFNPSGLKGLYVPNAGDTLTIGAGVTVHGITGFIGGAGDGSLTNDGTIAADGGGTFTVQGATNYAGGTITGGTWQASGSSILQLIGANITTNDANILLNGAGAQIYQNNGTSNALTAFATNAATGSFTIENGANFTSAQGFANAGTLIIGRGSTFAPGGTFTTTSGGSTQLQGGTLGAPQPPPAHALSFSGNGDYVAIQDAPSLRPTSLTLEGWVNFSSLPSGVLSLFGKALGSSYLDSYAVWYQQGVLYAAIANTSSFATVQYSWTPALNTWYDVAFTFDSVAHAEVLYIDGTPIDSRTTTFSIAYDTHPLLLGADVDTQLLQYFFPGLISDFSLWNVARTQAQIQSDFTSVLTGNVQGLSAYLPLDEGSGSIVFDQTANGNNGTPGSGVSASQATNLGGFSNTVPVWVSVMANTINIQGGTLSGPGTAFGNLTNAGEVDVGSSAGTLTVLGNYSQSSSGTLAIKIGGTTAGSQYDQLDVSGSVALAGTLNVSLFDGFGPSAPEEFSPITTQGGISGSFDTTNLPSVDGQTAFTVQTAQGPPASVNLVAVISSPDLAVSGSSIMVMSGQDFVNPAVATGTTGQNVTIAFAVQNVSPIAATGSWTDSVYLAADGLLDADSVLLGRVNETGGLGGMQSYNGMLTAQMPGVADSRYYLIVVADSGLQVPDLNRNNNVGVSTTALPVSTAILSLGAPVSGTIADGQDEYYRVNVVPGASVKLAATFAQGNESGFFVRFGGLPTLTTFDESSSDLTNLSPQVVLPASQGGGPYYILLNGTSGAATGQSFTLAASLAALGITNVSPPAALNQGPVTLTVNGTGFTAQTAVNLIDSNGDVVPSTIVSFVNPNQLTATFDLTGKVADNYSVQVIDGGESATATGALLVSAPQSNSQPNPAIRTTIISPGTVEVGEPISVSVSITNFGPGAVQLPVFEVNAPNANIDPSSGAGGLLGGTILEQGATYSFGSIYIPNPKAAHTTSTFALATVPGQSSIDWNSQKAQLQPPGVPDDAWDAIYANFIAAVGSDAADLENALQADENYLAQIGDPETDQSSLMSFQEQLANDSDPVPVLSSTIDNSYPEPGLSLSFQRSFVQSISGRYRLGTLGRGWVANWDISATTLNTDSGQMVLIQEGPVTRQFILQYNGTYQASPGDTGTLTLTGGSYSLRETNGAVTQFLPDGQLAYVQDNNGNRITAGYTGGLLTSLTAANGDQLTFVYNSQGRISSVEDPSGSVTTYAYDASGQYLMSASNALGVTQYTYVTGQSAVQNNALASIAYPDGTHTNFSYDTQGRLTGQSGDNGAGAITYGYLAPAGYTETDASGNTTTILTDSNGLPAVVKDAQGNVYHVSYNASGEPVLTTAPDGTASSIGYDSQGNADLVVDALGNTSQYSYSQTDQLQTFKNALGATTTFGYDPSGNVSSITQPDGTAVQYSYNSQGQVTSSTDAEGRTTYYVYDNELLKSVDYPDGTYVDYVYNTRGDMTSATNADGTITFTYGDAANPDLATEVSYPNGQSLEYSYYPGGIRKQMVYPDGYTVNYAYDADGRLSNLTDGSGAAIVTYRYNNADQLIRQDNGNGTYTIYTYYPIGLVQTLVNYAPGGTINSEFDYSYNNLGLVTSVTTLEGATTYGYDADGKLTSVMSPSGEKITYTYDAVGNRISEMDNGVITSYTTNGLNNECMTVGGTTYSYDANGNLVSTSGPDGTTMYTYDAENRLIGVTTPTDTWTYSYDALGNLSAVTHNGQSAQYLVDPSGLGNVVGEYDGSGKFIAEYTQGLGLVSQVASGASYYYDFDVSGSTAGLSGPSGIYVDSYSYLPFGELQSAKGTLANPFQYDGQSGAMAQGDGLTIMRARFYSPPIGRFLSQDPAGLSQGANLYTFAANNPLSFVDPSGFVQVIVGGGANVRAAFGDTILTDAGRIELASREAAFYEAEYQARSAIEDALTPGSWPDVNPFKNNLDSPEGFSSAEIMAAVQAIDAQDAAEAARLSTVEVPGFQIQKVIPRPGESFLDTLARGLLPQKEGLIPRFTVNSNAYAAKTTTEQVGPDDPNFLSGPAGFGTQNFIPDQTLPYVIGFENEASASAPAQVVTVRQQLDPNLDWSTFQLGAFGFGGQAYSIPAGLTSYSARIDDRDTAGVYVDVSAQFDAQTGVATWTFTSIDPATLDVPVGNPLEGFLPPDVTAPKGNGWVIYFVQPKADDDTAVVIDGTATVIFQAGLPSQSSLDTAPIFNTIDAGAPTSSVTALPSYNPTSFLVNWSGSDDADGSGIATYDVYVSDDDNPYTLWQSGTTETSATYAGQDGHTYSFYSIATDNVGNVQPTPTSAQATTTVDAVPPTSSVTALPAFETSTSFLLQWSGADNPGGSGLASYSIYVSEDGGAFQPFLSDTTQTSAIYTGQDGHSYALYSIATDNAGNVQPTPATAQATTTVDTSLPNSSVSALPTYETSTSFLVQWSASAGGDDAGIASYTVYVSDDGGNFHSFLTGTTQTSAIFTAGQDGHTYGFYSVATDNAGNVQPTPSAAQATTTVDATPPTSSVAPLPTDSRSNFTVRWAGQDNPGGSGIASYDVYVSEDNGAFSAFLTDTTQTSTSFPGVDGHTYSFYSIAHDVAGNTQTVIGPIQSTTVALAAQSVIVKAPSQAIAGGHFTATVEAVDADGLVDPLYSGSLALLLNSSSTTARLSGVVTAVVHNGVATFPNLAINLPGTWSLAAASTSDLLGGTAAIVIQKPPQFKVTLAPAAPGNSGASQSFNLGITALLNGKPDSSYLGTVEITSSDSQVPPGTYTFLPGDEGSKTLPITFKTPGRQTVTVADASLPSVKATSNAVSVTGSLPLKVDHFTLSGFPTADVSGSAHSVTITAVSVGGKIVTSYQGSVLITSSDPLFAPFSVSMTNGVGKASVTLTSLGSQSLTATDADGKTGADSAIDVVSPATHLGITTSPAKIMAGGQVTVTVTGLTASKKTDTLFADTLLLTTSDPHAQVVAQPMANGVQTFTITFTTAGTQTIAVTDLTRPAIKGSVSSVSVSAAGASQLSVTGFPLFAVAGVSQHFTVTAEDRYGNPVLNGFTDTIEVAGVSYPFKSSYHGSHLFTLTPTTSMQSLTATDTTNATVQAGSEGNITIVSASTAMIADPANRTKTALVVIVPAGGGSIIITPANAAGTSVTVKVNGNAVKGGPFAPTGHIIVYGQGGNDIVKEVAATINGQSAKIAIPAVVLGGTGTNTLSMVGSSANNVVVGGAGKDALTGGSGNDILIGGRGPDILTAGSGDDVLIGGSTVYDSNLAALMALMAEWGQTGVGFETRMQDLFGTGTAGANGSFLLDAQTVVRDSAINQLSGGTGKDWFWLSLSGPTADKISGFADGDANTFE